MAFQVMSVHLQLGRLRQFSDKRGTQNITINHTSPVPKPLLKLSHLVVLLWSASLNYRIRSSGEEKQIVLCPNAHQDAQELSRLSDPISSACRFEAW